MQLSFFIYKQKILVNFIPFYLCFFFYYRIFRKTFFFLFKFFYRYFFDSFLHYDFQLVDLIYFFSFNYFFYNYYCFLKKYGLSLKVG